MGELLPSKKMSIDHRVVIAEGALPPMAAIISAARARGSTLDLDVADTPLSSGTGYLPCTVDGHVTGFEIWAAASAASMEVTLTTHGDLIELAAAMITAFAIADASSGLIYDDYSPDPCDPTELHAEATSLLDS